MAVAMNIRENLATLRVEQAPILPEIIAILDAEGEFMPIPYSLVQLQFSAPPFAGLVFIKHSSRNRITDGEISAVIVNARGQIE